MNMEIVETPHKRKLYPRKPRKIVRKSRKKAPRKKKNPYTVKALDTVFSSFIRQSNADSEGIVTCYTCGYRTHYKKIHAGHYITRYYKTTRWDENNVKPQCFACNIYKKGNSVIYRINLVRDLGEKTVQKMEETAQQLLRGSAKDVPLQELIEKYTQKLAQLSA